MIETGTIERSETGGGGGWLINHLPTILWHGVSTSSFRPSCCSSSG